MRKTSRTTNRFVSLTLVASTDLGDRKAKEEQSSNVSIVLDICGLSEKDSEEAFAFCRTHI